MRQRTKQPAGLSDDEYSDGFIYRKINYERLWH